MRFTDDRPLNARANESAILTETASSLVFAQASFERAWQPWAKESEPQLTLWQLVAEDRGLEFAVKLYPNLKERLPHEPELSSYLEAKLAEAARPGR